MIQRSRGRREARPFGRLSDTTVFSILQDEPGRLWFGLADYAAPEALDEWIHRADEAMYRGKQSGKNRVVVAEAVDGEEGAHDTPRLPQ